MFSSKKIFMAGKRTRTVTISQQPASQTASNGTATFNVAAEVDDGSPPRYQWQKQPGNVATWEQYQLPTSNTWGKTLYNNGRFATIATRGNVVITSDDGINWTERTLPIDTDETWVDGACGAGRFVFISIEGKSVYSNDGVVWAQTTMSESQFGAEYNAITYGNNTFVAITRGGSPDVATSTNGSNWTFREDALPSGAIWRAVAFGGGSFVAVSYSNNMAARSSNGTNWVLRTLPATANWDSVTYAFDKFFVYTSSPSSLGEVNQDGVMISSDAGWNWTQNKSTNYPFGMSNIVAGDNSVVAIVDDSAYSSQNGLSWSEFPMAFPENMSNQGKTLAFGDDFFLAVGNSSAFVSGLWSDVEEATTDTLALAGLTAENNNENYRVVVGATDAKDVISDTASLTVA